MKKSNQHIDDFFKKAFQEASMSAPNAVWEKLENSINNPQDAEFDASIKKAFENKTASPSATLWPNIEAKQRKKRRRAVGFWISGIAASLALLLGVFGFLNTSNELFLADAYQSSDEVKANTASSDEMEELTLNEKSKQLTDKKEHIETEQNDKKITAVQKEQVLSSAKKVLNALSIQKADTEKMSLQSSKGSSQIKLYASNDKILDQSTINYLTALPPSIVMLKTKNAELYYPNRHHAWPVVLPQDKLDEELAYNYPKQGKNEQKPRVFAFGGVGTGVSNSNFYSEAYDLNQLKELSANNVRSAPATAQIQSSYQVNAFFGYPLGKRFDLQFGLGYTQWNGTAQKVFSTTFYKLSSASESITLDKTTFQNNYRPISNYQSLSRAESQAINTASIDYQEVQERDTVSTNYSFSFIELPLSVRYVFGHKRLNYFLSAGISAYINSSFTSGNYEGVLNESEIQIQSNNAPFQLNVLLSPGVEYSLGQAWSFRAQPRFSYGLRQQTEAASQQAQYNTLSVLAGLSYYF